ncbi:MAG: excinuclease ABC subunit UvrB [Bacteroidia bacterium]
MRFQLVSDKTPKGDQPQAIAELVEGIRNGLKHQVLLGVTGSGKTFTIANVIEKVQLPTLVLSPNKLLAWQLYNEFKELFPHNLVEYFISYYDYYQPEAYIPSTDTYIEKDLSILKEIEKYRLRATTSLISGRHDVIVVASVSSIYGLGDPQEFAQHTLTLHVGDNIPLSKFLQNLTHLLYHREDESLQPGYFRVRGEVVEIWVPYKEDAYRITFWDDEIESLHRIDPLSGKRIESLAQLTLFATSLFVISPQTWEKAKASILEELKTQSAYLREIGRTLEAERLEKRVRYDMEMIETLGYCKGIENYSRHLTGRAAGSRPYTLLDYFPRPFLTVIDESHVAVPQLRAMIGGDQSRKLTLVEYGFRLPSALDNRPLKFDEFEALIDQVIYVSATPGPYELTQTGGIFVEQVVRPTGLVDPPVEVHPAKFQFDHLLGQLQKVHKNNERALVIALTKKFAEEIASYLLELGVPARYIHSGMDAIERVEAVRQLRKGEISVLVGVNLLREGLDLPEVTLVAILDADKEGFLRSETSLIQIAGRAARNVKGRVILYADQITPSMQRFLTESERRRRKQLTYNEKHHIIPQTVYKPLEAMDLLRNQEFTPKKVTPSAQQEAENLSPKEIEKLIQTYYDAMMQAAEQEEYLVAAQYRDRMQELQALWQKKVLLQG